MKHHEPPFVLSELKVELTHRCPLACVHCSSEASPSNSCAMSPEFARSITQQACAMGVQRMVFSGGEPLMWEGVDQLVSLCAEMGVNATIYTSGTSEGAAESLVHLRSAGLRSAVFSLFASTSEMHDRTTRVLGSYSKTLNAIRVASEGGIATEIHFVPMRANYRELPAVIELAKDTGIRQVSVLRFVPQGRGAVSPAMALSRDQNLELRSMILEGRKKIELRTGSPYNFLLVNKDPACSAGIDTMSVGPDGSICPCDAFKQIGAAEFARSDAFSNLRLCSLRECWEKSPYLGVVREHLTSPFGPPCRDCDLLEQCLSGCLAQKYIAYGKRLKSPDPMCLKGK